MLISIIILTLETTDKLNKFDDIIILKTMKKMKLPISWCQNSLKRH